MDSEARLKKLSALLQSYELEERDIIKERVGIEHIRDQRQSSYDEVVAVQHLLQKRIQSLGAEVAIDALRKGDSVELHTMERYREKLQLKLDTQNALVAQKFEELTRVEERFTEIENLLVATRLKKKKLEKLMDSRNSEARIVEAATEEALLDEMNFFLGKHSKS